MILTRPLEEQNWKIYAIKCLHCNNVQGKSRVPGLCSHDEITSYAWRRKSVTKEMTYLLKQAHLIVCTTFQYYNTTECKMDNTWTDRMTHTDSRLKEIEDKYKKKHILTSWRNIDEGQSSALSHSLWAGSNMIESWSEFLLVWPVILLNSHHRLIRPWEWRKIHKEILITQGRTMTKGRLKCT